MFGVGKSVRLGLLALTACAGAGEAAAGILSPSEQRKLGLLLERRQMVFFVAKGPADSCGKGCDEWIAAVGSIDIGADKRLLEFIKKLNGRRLPIYFHSPGGLSGTGFRVGRILREQRMTAGIGRTVAKCRVFEDEGCREKARAGESIRAELVTTNATCSSACNYAFAGAPTRHLGPGVLFGVHSSGTYWSRESAERLTGNPDSKVPKTNKQDSLQVKRRYYVDMGIDPGLADFAAKTPYEQMYVLDRGEIERFRLETRGERYEAPWTMSKFNDGKFDVLKSITRRTTSDPPEHLTLRFHFWCTSDGYAAVSYRRDMALSQAQAAASVQLAFDGGSLEFNSLKSQSGSESKASYLYEDTFRKLAATKTLIVKEKMKIGEHKIETSLSSAGLREALMELRRHCTAGFRQRPGNAPTYSPVTRAALGGR